MSYIGKRWRKFWGIYLIVGVCMSSIPVSAKAVVKEENHEAENVHIIRNSDSLEQTGEAGTPNTVELPEQTEKPAPTQPAETVVPTQTPSGSPTPVPDVKPAAPVLNEAVADEKGIHITFSSVEGAESYHVFMRKAGSSDTFKEVKELDEKNYSAVMAQGGVFLSVEEEEVELGDSYEIMVRSSMWVNDWDFDDSWSTSRDTEVFSEDSNVVRADMPQDVVAGVEVKARSESSVKITWDRLRGVNGYEIVYSLTESGSYQTAAIIQGDSVTSWVHHNLEIGTTYYYKVYALGEVTKSYSAVVRKCLVTFAKPKGVKSEMAGPTKMKLSWQKVSGASGYIIYRSETKNEWTKGKLKKYKELRGGQKTKLTVPRVKNGKCYHYQIMAYTVKNGVTIEGNAAEYNRYADYYGHENESYTNRWKRIYGKKKSEYDYRKSGKYMTTIRVKVWDFAHGMSGRKITKVKTLTVHKKIAPTMKKIFQEIYRGKEKAPIYEVGGYSARSGQHGQGLGIDINSNYNYMVQGKKVLAGSCWKPGKYAYSIKRNGDIEKAFRKYGYSRGLWGDRKDYMHFSYFGT